MAKNCGTPGREAPGAFSKETRRDKERYIGRLPKKPLETRRSYFMKKILLREGLYQEKDSYVKTRYKYESELLTKGTG